MNIVNAYLVIEECYTNGGKLLIVGNGYSAINSEHIAGKLMKRFKNLRLVNKNFECSLMIIPLVEYEAIATTYINDVDGIGVFAQ